MKIGVAFSGSGAGASAAYAFADELQKCSVSIDMLSATSLAAVSTLLWAKGLCNEEIEEFLDLFAKTSPCPDGLRLFEQMKLFEKEKPVCDVAVNSVDCSTGVSVIYSDTLRSDAWNLKVLPLTGNERAALSSSLSPYAGMEPYLMDGMRLCDFSVRYGCPYFPLKMAGMERLLSVAFSGGELPAQIAADSLSALTGKNANLHYSVKLESGEDAAREVRAFVQKNIDEIYDKLLF